MRISKAQQRAAMQLLTARSWPARISAGLVLAAAAFSWWQQGQVKPGQLVKGGLLQGRVVDVADGDTITLQDAGRQTFKLRLAYIDAPEKAMPFGPDARRNLEQMLDGKQVEAHIDDVDQYGRGVARVRSGGQDVNQMLVAKGYAWHYSQYARKAQSGADFAKYDAAQAAARSQKRGLWRDANPTPPWQWRNAQR